MEDREKITTGLNDRPLNHTIAQTGDGLPDDSGQPVEVDPAEVERVRAKLMEDDANPETGKATDADEDAKAG